MDTQVWEDFITEIEKSKKEKEAPKKFLLRMVGEGYEIVTPASTDLTALKVKFCRDLIISRKDREPIEELVNRKVKAGYSIMYVKRKVSSEKRKFYLEFIKEVKNLMATDELIEDFIERVERLGFTLTYSTPSSDRDFFIKVIEYLNQKAETKFRTTYPSPISRLVLARKAAGHSWIDFKTVIDRKVAHWKNTEYEEYLRPITLFHASKFENYLGANDKAKAATTAGVKGNFGKLVGSVQAAKAAAERIITERSEARPNNSKATDY